MMAAPVARGVDWRRIEPDRAVPPLEKRTPFEALIPMGRAFRHGHCAAGRADVHPIVRAFEFALPAALLIPAAAQ
jgi:hypothetical protein